MLFLLWAPLWPDIAFRLWLALIPRASPVAPPPTGL